MLDLDVSSTEDAAQEVGDDAVDDVVATGGESLEVRTAESVESAVDEVGAVVGGGAESAGERGGSGGRNGVPRHGGGSAHGGRQTEVAGGRQQQLERQVDGQLSTVEVECGLRGEGQQGRD